MPSREERMKKEKRHKLMKNGWKRVSIGFLKVWLHSSLKPGFLLILSVWRI
jgi:hypothetical protein